VTSHILPAEFMLHHFFFLNQYASWIVDKSAALLP